jgi:predicted RNase H-like nuclease (RuvC/YqgF family)
MNWDEAIKLVSTDKKSRCELNGRVIGGEPEGTVVTFTQEEVTSNNWEKVQDPREAIKAMQAEIKNIWEVLGRIDAGLRETKARHERHWDEIENAIAGLEKAQKSEPHEHGPSTPT